jgi:hypothetical protein
LLRLLSQQVQKTRDVISTEAILGELSGNQASRRQQLSVKFSGDPLLTAMGLAL